MVKRETLEKGTQTSAPTSLAAILSRNRVVQIKQEQFGFEQQMYEKVDELPMRELELSPFNGHSGSIRDDNEPDAVAVEGDHSVTVSPPRINDPKLNMECYVRLIRVKFTGTVEPATGEAKPVPARRPLYRRRRVLHRLAKQKQCRSRRSGRVTRRPVICKICSNCKITFTGRVRPLSIKQ